MERLAKLGEVKRVSDHEILLEVRAEAAASVASYLFANVPVQDVLIADPPLEELIETIYARNR